MEDFDGVLSLNLETGFVEEFDVAAFGLHADINLFKPLLNVHLLTLVMCNNANLKDDMGCLANCQALEYLDLSDTAVSGDVGCVHKCTNLMYLNLRGTRVQGDIKALR